jgi:hypothetical protein
LVADSHIADPSGTSFSVRAVDMIGGTTRSIAGNTKATKSDTKTTRIVNKTAQKARPFSFFKTHIHE